MKIKSTTNVKMVVLKYLFFIKLKLVNNYFFLLFLFILKANIFYILSVIQVKLILFIHWLYNLPIILCYLNYRVISFC